MTFISMMKNHREIALEELYDVSTFCVFEKIGRSIKMDDGVVFVCTELD